MKRIIPSEGCLLIEQIDDSKSGSLINPAAKNNKIQKGKILECTPPKKLNLLGEEDPDAKLLGKSNEIEWQFATGQTVYYDQTLAKIIWVDGVELHIVLGQYPATLGIIEE